MEGGGTISRKINEISKCKLLESVNSCGLYRCRTEPLELSNSLKSNLDNFKPYFLIIKFFLSVQEEVLLIAPGSFFEFALIVPAVDLISMGLRLEVF